MIGPIHTHTDRIMQDAWDSHSKQAPLRPQFMIEFGKDGEDYGGAFVCYTGWCHRERDGVKQEYSPEGLAALIAKAPEMQSEIDDLRTINASYKRRYEKAEEQRDAHDTVRQRHLIRIGRMSSEIERLEAEIQSEKEARQTLFDATEDGNIE